MDLTIIVVSWNTCRLLRDCLASVLAAAPSCTYDIWVTDNDSADDSVAMLQEQFPQVHLIENEVNGGFAQANNQAIEASSSKYVLLLNPDTLVRPGAIQYLVDYLEENPEAGAAGSRLLNPDLSLQPSCHPRPTLSRELWRMFHLDFFVPHGRYAMDTWDTTEPREVDVIQGAAFIMRRSIIEQIGFLDATYFMFSEEVDLCYRLQRHGWRLFWVPQSEVIHYGGQSTRQVADKMFIELYRGKVHFFRKHYGHLQTALYKAVLFLAALPRIALPLLLARLDRSRKEQWQLMNHQYQQLLQHLSGL